MPLETTHMPTNPRTYETFCTVDKYGCIISHDTLRDAERARDDLIGAEVYVGRFTPFTGSHKRLTLHQCRVLWVVAILLGSVLLDVVVPEGIWLWGLSR